MPDPVVDGGERTVLKRVELEITFRGDGRNLREIKDVLEPDFRGEGDVEVQFILEGTTLRVILAGSDLSHLLATVGTLTRLVGVYEDISRRLEDL